LKPIIDLSEAKKLAKAFHIPPDTDDSSVNLALGAALKRNKEQFPNAYRLWTEKNYGHE
jgi:hypothetical protein